jgi:hypothetical protein
MIEENPLTGTAESSQAQEWVNGLGQALSPPLLLIGSSLFMRFELFSHAESGKIYCRNYRSLKPCNSSG